MSSKVFFGLTRLCGSGCLFGSQEQKAYPSIRIALARLPTSFLSFLESKVSALRGKFDHVGKHRSQRCVRRNSVVYKVLGCVGLRWTWYNGRLGL
ncbi:hypothetical protein R1flu_027921 [Riccia fluitans]|uniref:Secreted protein n=1 Tax=Riccia fluitans TaxID=41844 RepID=A0ABD1XKW1_9MARC